MHFNDPVFWYAVLEWFSIPFFVCYWISLCFQKQISWRIILHSKTVRKSIEQNQKFSDTGLSWSISGMEIDF